MIIRAKKNWKDLADNKGSHEGTKTSRRDFLEKGLATGVMSICLPNFLTGKLIETASAADLVCPPPQLFPGAIAQIFSEGGPTMGARFFSDAQASLMTAVGSGMASNYGITGGGNLVKIGPNLNVDRTSPFGFTLLAGPPGYVGGAAAWKSEVLDKLCGGGHLGPFNADDGAGENSGLLGGISPFKASKMGKDLKVNISSQLATWAMGLPSASVASSSPTNFAKTFTLNPAANGLITTQALDLASKASTSISDAMALVLKNGARKSADVVKTAAGCGFFGNSALADPGYGNRLFTPNDGRLTGKLNVGALSVADQGFLAAYFQSALGVAGGVITQFGGRDYHGGDPASDIAPKDIEEARNIVMFLAACKAANAPGAMMYFSNGQAIANGTAAIQANVNGATVNMNAPRAAGDAGGSYNAGLIIFFHPNGNLPSSKFTGTVDSDGNAKTDAKVGSSKEAVAGLYLSALAFINNGNLSPDTLAKMQASGVAENPTNIMVI